MKKYHVNFGTGAGNFDSDLPLNKLMKEVESQVAYTHKNVMIEDGETREDIACLPWNGRSPMKDEYVTAQFGNYGYYGEWIIF